MKKFKRYLMISFATVALAIIGLVLINLQDSSLNGETTAALQNTVAKDKNDDLKCAALLGLAVDPNLDFEAEGMKLLNSIQEIARKDFYSEEAPKIPQSVKPIRTTEQCTGYCLYSEPERKRLRAEINQQKYLLERLQKLVAMGDVQCQNPMVLVRLPVLSPYYLMRNLILHYQLLAQEGQVQQSLEGLFKVNSFVEKSLMRQKYSIISGIIQLNALKSTRESVISINAIHQKSVPKVSFVPLKYDEIIKRGE
jgi:hypothetical protein